MAIRFIPSDVLKKIAPKKAVEKLVTQKLTLNRAALSTIARFNGLSKKTVERVALKVIKGYKKAYGNFRDAGASKAEALKEAINKKRLLLQRVQNAAIFEITEAVKETYDGEIYEWLPSDANEPDPLHQLNYGKKFKLGVGEAPGDRYGCRCGMNILVSDDTLSI